MFRVFALVMAAQVSILTYAQDNTSYSFLVAGHAYGAHAGTNLGLHPPFLSKLHEIKDTTVEGLFLTGDIVNVSTAASWAQVEKELSELGLPGYFIMGNHDNNTIGKAEFIRKHGGLYYNFNIHNDVYIILNSTESDRSISTTQLAFLADVLQKAPSANKRVFIFFHEVIWNSADKYRLVRSNSRSRYDLIKGVSNFWQKVVPILDTYPEKQFYLFSGDVGGNPDAIAAFYDRWGHMTLLSSGMGEVPDENYMKVDVTPDTVTYRLIPFNNAVKMDPVSWYSVPARPKALTGPSTVYPPQSDVKYEAEPVANATSYLWTLSNGITRNNDSIVISLNFDSSYQTGHISVRAVKDGFGESDPVTLQVNASDYTSAGEINYSSALMIQQNERYILLNHSAVKCGKAQVKVFDLTGKLLYHETIGISNGLNSIRIDKNPLGKGMVILDYRTDKEHLNKKIVLY